MGMTPIEKRLFRESIIKEYKEQHAAKLKKISLHHKFISRLKRVMPISILLGIIASVIYIYVKGWYEFFILLLTGTIWITLISAFISAFLKGD